MNYEELNMEYWGRIVPMVRDYNTRNGTNIRPGNCVKCDGLAVCSDHPRFNRYSNEYELAIAILEGKPVFIDDTVYHKQSGVERIINTSELSDDFEDNFTWQPPKPKRTFMLNGVELPCPVDWTESANGDIAVIDGEVFWFRNSMERDLVRDTISRIFNDARNKQ